MKTLSNKMTKCHLTEICLDRCVRSRERSLSGGIGTHVTAPSSISCLSPHRLRHHWGHPHYRLENNMTVQPEIADDDEKKPRNKCEAYLEVGYCRRIRIWWEHLPIETSSNEQIRYDVIKQCTQRHPTKEKKCRQNIQAT